MPSGQHPRQKTLLADSPILVPRRMRHGHPVLLRLGVDRMDLGGRTDPPAHPSPARVVVPHLSRRRSAAATLRAQLMIDLAGDTAVIARGRKDSGCFSRRR